MAHNLEFNSQKGTTSFFSRKDMAWHGLGQVIQEAVTAEEALKLANLDYQVELKPIYSSFIPDGCTVKPVLKDNKTQFEVFNKTGLTTGIIIPKKGELLKDNKAVCRMDNLTPLGIVGNKYTPVQNIESLDFIYNILKKNPDLKEKNDIIIETAGVLGNGERIFVTAKLPKEFKIGNEDSKTDLYIVFTNSHDGTSSLTAMITPVRVVCNNTLACALGNNKSKYKFRHTKNIHNQLKEGLVLLNLAYESFDANKQVYDALLNIKVDSDLIDELICKAMLNDNQLLTINQQKGLEFVSTEVISQRLRNVMIDMRDYIDSGCGQEFNRGTAYWAYMGMNSYLNNGTNYSDALSKFNNLSDGTTSKQDSKILSTFVHELL